jgi:hypothetical protein
MVEASWLLQLPSLRVSVSWVSLLIFSLPATGIKVEVLRQSNFPFASERPHLSRPLVFPSCTSARTEQWESRCLRNPRPPANLARGVRRLGLLMSDSATARPRRRRLLLGDRSQNSKVSSSWWPFVGLHYEHLPTSTVVHDFEQRTMSSTNGASDALNMGPSAGYTSRETTFDPTSKFSFSPGIFRAPN